jgi:hypothetical protein
MRYSVGGQACKPGCAFGEARTVGAGVDGGSAGDRVVVGLVEYFVLAFACCFV